MWIALGCVPFLRGAKTFSHSLDPKRILRFINTAMVAERADM